MTADEIGGAVTRVLAAVDQRLAALATATTALDGLGPWHPMDSFTALAERRAVRHAWAAAADALDDAQHELARQLVHAEAARRGINPQEHR